MIQYFEWINQYKLLTSLQQLKRADDLQTNENTFSLIIAKSNRDQVTFQTKKKSVDLIRSQDATDTDIHLKLISSLFFALGAKNFLVMLLLDINNHWTF